MARPKTKDQLLAQSGQAYEALIDLVQSLSPDKVMVEFPPSYLNRNVRDVLGHLHHWHLMMLDWYQLGMAGQRPQMPAPGYTWRTVPELNRAIQAQYQNNPLPDILERLQASSEAVEQLIIQHTEEELFTKKHYPWTGSTSLGAYLISATSSHYDWASKLIRKALKQVGVPA